MKKQLQFILLSFFTGTTVLAQTPVLGGVLQNKSGSIYSGNQGNGICLDASGTVYVAGSYSGNVDLDPGTGTISSTTADYASDGYIQKINASGTLIWAKVLKSVGMYTNTSCSRIGTDANGNVYIAGIFTNTTNLAPAPASHPATSNGYADVFVSKLDPNGNFLWTYTFGNAQNDIVEDMVVDAAGSVYLTGPVNGTIDFDPSAAEHSITGSNDIYALKISSSGNFEWLLSVVDAGDGYIYGISLDNANHVLISGNFNGTVDFDPSPTQTYTLTRSGGATGFILVLDKNTTAFSWVYTTNEEDRINVLGVTADSTGNIYATGTFDTKTDFDNSTGVSYLEPENSYADIFILKVNPTGHFCWAKSIGGEINEEYANIVFDPYDQSINIAGTQRYSMDCDPGPAVANTLFYGSGDIYMVKLDTAGVYKWSTSIGGSSNETVYDHTVYQSKIYATGYFEGTVDFDPSPTVTNNLSVNGGNGNTYIVNVINGVVTEISESASSAAMSAYPNPNQGRVTIQTTEEMNNASLKLITLAGEVVMQQEQLNGTLFTVDLMTQKNGIYILELHQHNTVSKIKLVKVQ